METFCHFSLLTRKEVAVYVFGSHTHVKSDPWLKTAGTQRAGLFELCLSSALVDFVS